VRFKSFYAAAKFEVIFMLSLLKSTFKNIIHFHGQTDLMNAVCEGSLEDVKFILREGRSAPGFNDYLNRQNNDGQTALILSLIHYHDHEQGPAIFGALIQEYELNPNEQDQTHKTAIEYAMDLDLDDEGRAIQNHKNYNGPLDFEEETGAPDFYPISPAHETPLEVPSPA
jgi:ankyrin repeat protein